MKLIVPALTAFIYVLSACSSTTQVSGGGDAGAGNEAGATGAGAGNEAGASGAVASNEAGASGEGNEAGASGEGNEAGASGEGSDALDAACTPTVEIQQEDTGANGMIFAEAVPDPDEFVKAAGREVCRILYRKPEEVRAANKVKIILRDDPEVVANKSGDVGDIEIVVSTAYLATFRAGGGDIRTELNGILSHEMTHMYQNDDRAPGEGTYANLGNVIEGVADFVRIRAGLAPADSQPLKTGMWDDEGYAKPAYFLLYVDDKYPNFLYELNLSLVAGDGEAWTPESFEDLTGETVDDLWSSYVAAACCTDTDKTCCK